MTIRQKFEETLVNHGLWEKEARGVVEQAEIAKTLEDMLGRWDDEVEGYPPQLLAVIWITVKEEAKNWLQTNAPNHFALAMLS